MHRIDTPTASADENGSGKAGFRAGAPPGTASTRLDHHWFNAVQEELCAVVEGAGTTLVKATKNQVFTAIGSIATAIATTIANTAVAAIAAIVSNRVVLTKGVSATAVEANGNGGVFTGLGNGEGVVGQGGDGGSGGGVSGTGGTDAAGVIGKGGAFGTTGGRGVSGEGTGGQPGVYGKGGPSGGAGIIGEGGAGLALGVIAKAAAASNGMGLDAIAYGENPAVRVSNEGSGPAISIVTTHATTSGAQIRFAAIDDPAADDLQDGDLWFTGTAFRCRIGGVTRTFTVT